MNNNVFAGTFNVHDVQDSAGQFPRILVGLVLLHLSTSSFGAWTLNSCELLFSMFVNV